MNYKITAFLTFFMAAVTFSVTAQSEFKVLASKGANKVTSNKVTTDITIGKKLLKNDKIVVGPNGYLGLAHSCGKTIEIKTPGTYDVNKLSTEVAAQNKGICKKYVDYVVGEMTSQDENMAQNKYKYMAVTGSVERGLEIKSYIPQKSSALNGPVTLTWLPEQGIQNYVVKVSNLFDETIYLDTTTSTTATVDFLKLNFKEEKAFMWEVKALNALNTTGARMISTLPDTKDAELKAEFTEIKQELGSETALNKFILANVYADKGLLIDAIANFEAAIAMEPQMEVYKTAYNKFLVDHKLAEATK